ncbi:MAG: myo-inosose-2 dehydratase [Parvibaculaceae bacterium]
MTVRIGINPNTWTLDDIPELKDFSTLDQCLLETKASHYSGIEMGGIFPRTADGLKRALGKYDLDLISGWYAGHILEKSPEAEFDAVLPHLATLREMGCACVVYADCSGETFSDATVPLAGRPKLTSDEWKNYGRKITELAQMMAEFGVPMSFHHHIGTIVESDEDVDALMANTDAAVGLLLDTGHSSLAGGDPVRLAKRHARRINHFHGKDVRIDVLQEARRSNWSFVEAVLAGVYTVPGDGSTDYHAILSALHDAGFSGWLVVEAEQDLRKAHPLTYAKLGFTNLSRLAIAAGFMTVS